MLHVQFLFLLIGPISLEAIFIVVLRLALHDLIFFVLHVLLTRASLLALAKSIYYLGDLIYENCFHNCVGESEKALLVPVSTKGITVNHENWIEQHSKQESYFFNDFIHSCLDTTSQ